MKTKVKAILVVPAFRKTKGQDKTCPHQPKRPFKVMMAISANKGFQICALDVTNAYLQGKPLERESRKGHLEAKENCL